MAEYEKISIPMQMTLQEFQAIGRVLREEGRRRTARIKRQMHQGIITEWQAASDFEMVGHAMTAWNRMAEHVVAGLRERGAEYFGTAEQILGDGRGQDEDRDAEAT